MSDAAKWYVVHTYSGYENKVASSIEKAVENRKLHDLIPAVNIPTETVTEVKDGKSREVERKLFPGYVLVKMVMTDETWYLVRNTRGCTGFVGQDKSGGSKPIPLTEDEIAAMGVEKREIEVNYAVGDSVRVIDGPLAGFIGVVSALEPDKNRVNVTVSMSLSSTRWKHSRSDPPERTFRFHGKWESMNAYSPATTFFEGGTFRHGTESSRLYQAPDSRGQGDPGSPGRSGPRPAWR